LLAIYNLLHYQFALEVKRKAALGGLALYLCGSGFIAYLCFSLHRNQLTPLVWSALFWLIVLFTAISAIAKSFVGEKRGLDVYLYALASPQQIIIAKMIYNFCLSAALGIGALFLFFLLLGNPITSSFPFFLGLLLTCLGLATSLTLLAAIAARADHASILMPVLGFPITISLLLLAIKITKNCIDGLGFESCQDELLTLVAINCMAGATGYVLFPYIWRS